MVGDRFDTGVRALKRQQRRVHLVRCVLHQRVARAGHELLVPANEELIAVEVSAAHHVCLRPFALGGKDNDVVEFAELGISLNEILADCCQLSDIARMVARISRHKHFACDQLNLVDFFLSQFDSFLHNILGILHICILPEVVSFELDKNLIRAEYSVLIDNAEQVRGLRNQDARFFDQPVIIVAFILQQATFDEWVFKKIEFRLSECLMGDNLQDLRAVYIQIVNQ